MSATTTVRCDGKDCTQVKAEANHWHRARHITAGRNGGWILVGDFLPTGPPADFVDYDFCSERCLIAYISRFIGQEQAK